MNRVWEVAIRALAVWAVIMTGEFANGSLRIFLLIPHIGDFRARQVGVFTGSFLILLITLLSIRWLRATATRLLLCVGIFWLVLTLLFELGGGHFFFGRSWESLASDYNLMKGGLLPIGLVFLTLSPLIAAKIRGVNERHPSSSAS
jgi:hypothetical protein